MWIYSYYKGCVELWSRERGLSRVSTAYPPSFYMHLKDRHAHWEMIEGLESCYKVEECSFNTIFGTFQGTRSSPAEKWPRRIEGEDCYITEEDFFPHECKPIPLKLDR